MRPLPAFGRARRSREAVAWSLGSPALRRNPILEREVRSRWRRPLTYVVLLFYAAVLSWVAWNLSGTALEQSASLAEGFGSERAVKLPGAALFHGSVMAQVLTALWAGAMLCAPVVARERELKMLPELILANLSPAQIVSGKWLATLGFAAILLLIPLPLQALAFLMGGVSPLEWVAAAALQVGAMLLGSALGLWSSALNSRVASAMSGACATAAAASLPLVGAVVAQSPHLWLCTAFACALLAAPLIAGAQNSVRDLPLDPPRPEGIEQPPSPVQAPASPLARSFVLSPAGPAVAARSTWRGGNERGSERESEPVDAARARRELEELRVYGARRESWVFPLLRALGCHNPLVWRELRVRMRQPFADGLTFLVGMLSLALLPWALSVLFSSRPSDAFMLVLLVWLGNGIACALRAAQSFTREREQRMLEALLLSTMSPRAVVAGKVGVAILLCVYSGALPLSLFVGSTLLWGVSNGLSLALIALLGLACFALLGAACGAWLSFWCRTTAVAATGSLALLLGLTSAPMALMWLGNKAVRGLVESLWFGPVWNPLAAFDGSAGFFFGGLVLCSVVAGLALALSSHIALALRPQAVEREGRSILHTDLTRNLH